MNKAMWIGAWMLCMAVLVAAPPAGAAGVTFGQAVDSVDTQKHTKMAAKENWKKLRGTEVTWSGTVSEVKGGSSRAKLYVADRSRPLYKGHNIVVITGDLEKASKLKRGQTVRFRGVLDSYRSKRSGAVIELEKAQLL